MTATALAPESLWGYLNVIWTPDFSPCDHCGRPMKRMVLMENRDTGERMQVGRRCAEILHGHTG